MTAVAEPRHVGTTDWQVKMSASKAAVVMGYANPRWNSPKALFLSMTDPDKHRDETMSSASRRGTFLEAGLIDRWFYENPQAIDRHGGEKRYDREVEGFPFVATPDDEARIPASGTYLAADDSRVGIECKTVGSHAPDLHEWGEPGTDIIPRKYLVQVLFQQYMSGVRRTAVIKAGPYIDDFHTYWVEYNPRAADAIIARCVEFMECVRMGWAPPNDGAPATWEAVKRHNPEIIRDSLGEDWPVNLDLGIEYTDAAQSFAAAEARLYKAKSDLFEAMGKARRAVVELPAEIGKNGRPKKAKVLTIARRQGVKGGGVTLVAPPKPVDLDLLRSLRDTATESH